MSPPPDIHITIYNDLLEMLVAGKTVIVDHPDGSHIHIALQGIDWDVMMDVILQNRVDK